METKLQLTQYWAAPHKSWICEQIHGPAILMQQHVEFDTSKASLSQMADNYGHKKKVKPDLPELLRYIALATEVLHKVIVLARKRAQHDKSVEFLGLQQAFSNFNSLMLIRCRCSSISIGGTDQASSSATPIAQTALQVHYRDRLLLQKKTA